MLSCQDKVDAQSEMIPTTSKSCKSHKRKGDEDRKISEDCPKKQARQEVFEDREGETCPICLDSWTLSGGHRLVSLKCGHLFGNSCLERCLGMDKSCPQCRADVKKEDIRILYARKVVTSNTGALENTRRELQEKTLRLNGMEKKYQTLMRHHAILEFCNSVKTLKNEEMTYDYFNNANSTGPYSIDRLQADMKKLTKAPEYYALLKNNNSWSSKEIQSWATKKIANEILPMLSLTVKHRNVFHVHIAALAKAIFHGIVREEEYVQLVNETIKKTKDKLKEILLIGTCTKCTYNIATCNKFMCKKF
uniref:E3 ubiquitin-protein ligase RFWD3 n=1 Tax=Phallusia mammillata TaxID=59560 RepID=A0A6F9DQ26_9ASCI|nr:E3 ubiquitin-protein ligase RFWD3 [Phallusia mammillata]